MPAWRDVLTDDERWDVVNYLRAAFAREAGAATSTPGDLTAVLAETPTAR
jgi:mono/diheme cytochrome c family protein